MLPFPAGQSGKKRRALFDHQLRLLFCEQGAFFIQIRLLGGKQYALLIKGCLLCVDLAFPLGKLFLQLCLCLLMCSLLRELFAVIFLSFHEGDAHDEDEQEQKPGHHIRIGAPYIMAFRMVSAPSSSHDRCLLLSDVLLFFSFFLEKKSGRSVSSASSSILRSSWSYISCCTSCG